MPTIFQSITAFFTGGVPIQRDNGKHSHLRRDEAMLSVDDAFSIPPETDSVIATKAFTYPPPAAPSPYDIVPSSATSPLFPDLRNSIYPRTSKSRPTSLLPMQHSPLSPLPPYPPLTRTWSRIKAWLEQNYPELGDTLNYGIQPQDLNRLELELGQVLPKAVKDSYLVTDGQEAESAAGCSEGLFFGLTLLPLEDVVEEWKFWREVDEDPTTGANPSLLTNMESIPPRWIRKAYSQQGWIPLVTDKVGNYLGIDLNPDEHGSTGQVIAFGRDFDTKVVMWRGEGEAGWATWLASFAEDLENGEGFELGGGASEETSDNSEDDVGYESYFFDSAGKSSGGGGDTGGGGLRLTGDYKHWPVLEALADKSMRKWIEAGVMPPPSMFSKNPPTSALEDRPPKVTNQPESSTSSNYPNGDPLSVSTTSLPSPAEESITPLITPVRQPGDTCTKPKLNMQVSVPKPAPVLLPTEEDILPSPDELHPAEPHEIDEEMGLPLGEEDAETGRNIDSESSRLTRLQLDDRSNSLSSSSSETLLNASTPVRKRVGNAILNDVSEPALRSALSSLPLSVTDGNQHESGPPSNAESEEMLEADLEGLGPSNDLPESTSFIDAEHYGDPFVVASDMSSSSRPNSGSSIISVKIVPQSPKPSNDVP